MAQSEAEVQHSPANQWLAETLRVTAFPAPDAQVNPSGWWKHVVGQDPETEVQRQRVGELVQDGIVGSAKVALRVRPDRIDWIMAPIDPAQPPENFLTVGPFEESAKQFRALIDSWAPLSPAVSRIAFGTTAFLPAPDHTSGYKTLATYLPFVQVDPGSSDFSYQINRPRESKAGIEGLSINRLSKWSVAKMMMHAFSMDPQQGMRLVRAPFEVFACRVEIDINTSASYKGVLSPDQTLTVLNELEVLAKEILRDGDCP